MTASSSDLNDPYAPPAVEAELVTSRSLPRGLKVVAIIALVLGSIGALKSAVTVLALVGGAQLQGLLVPANALEEGPVPAREAQQQFQDDIQDVARSFLPWNVARTAVHLASALALIVGSIGALKLRPQSRTWLLVAFLSAIAYEVGSVTLDVLINLRLIPAVERFVESMAPEAVAPGAGDPVQVAKGIMYGVMIASICFGVLFSLIKTGFYLGSSVYLNRQTVTAHYDGLATGDRADLRHMSTGPQDRFGPPLN